jgi:hypothetical protein
MSYQACKCVDRGHDAVRGETGSEAGGEEACPAADAFLVCADIMWQSLSRWG